MEVSAHSLFLSLLKTDHSHKTPVCFFSQLLGDGEHIRIRGRRDCTCETIRSQERTVSSKDGVDTVKLSHDPGVSMRRRVLDPKTTGEDVLSEIADMKRFAHQPVELVYAS